MEDLCETCEDFLRQEDILDGRTKCSFCRHLNELDFPSDISKEGSIEGRYDET